MPEQSEKTAVQDRVQRSMNFDRERIDQIVAEADREMATEMSARVEVKHVAVVSAIVPVVVEAPSPIVVVASIAREKSETERIEKVEARRDAVRYSFLGWCLVQFKLESTASSLAFSSFLSLLAFFGLFGLGVDELFVFSKRPLHVLATACLLNCMFLGFPFGLPIAIAVACCKKAFAGGANAIANTAFGLWVAAKSTVVGIGVVAKWTGVGLYYAITNQLMPSFCWSN
ncbi:MAG: hypothetical protein Q8L24_01455 [bacterium]|nr:hypothetical protein [bacterium]